MAEELLSKSLDDLIAERAKKGGDQKRKGVKVGSNAPYAHGAGKPRGRGGSREDRGKPKGGRQDQQPQQQGVSKLDRALGVKDKKIAKPDRGNDRGPRRGRQGLQGPFVMGPGGAYLAHPTHMMEGGQAPPRGGGGRGGRQQRDGNVDGQWRHDRYQETDMGPPRRQQQASGQAGAGTRLSISNLHYNVTEKDIQELFSTVGPLISAKMDYDNSGRSIGTATVIYKAKKDALEAINQYNDIALDGQKLLIELEEGRDVAMLSSGLRVTKAVGGSGGGRRAGGDRMFQKALPRGMSGVGDDDSYGAPSRRGQGPGPRGGNRMRSSVAMPSADADDMLE